MTPNTWLSVLGFFFFVAPGLYYDRKAAQKRVKPPETTFGEISRVALVSTVCTIPALLLLGVFAAACHRWNWKLLPDPAALLKQGTGYYGDNFVKVSLTFLALAAIAFLSAEGLFRWRHRKDKSVMTFESAWREVMREDAPDNTVAYARVSMKDGSVWTGRVANFSRATEIADREIILAPKITRKPKPDPSGSQDDAYVYPAVYERVILKDAEIAYIAVRYDDLALAPTPPPTPIPTPSSGTSP